MKNWPNPAFPQQNNPKSDRLLVLRQPNNLHFFFGLPALLRMYTLAIGIPIMVIILMRNRIRLGVNIDHVATVRQARGVSYPSVVHAGHVAEMSGADLITVHLREDRRHIQDTDVRALRESLQVPLNLEMALTDEMLDVVLSVKPDWACLVPEKREELTTEGGLDVAGQQQRVCQVCQALTQAGIKVSLFVDPDRAQMQASADCGVQAVELHTGTYANHSKQAQRDELQRLATASEQAAALGLQVHAGHGLTRHNVLPVAQLEAVEELNIGHSLIADAVFVGLAESVATMRRLLDQVR